MYHTSYRFAVGLLAAGLLANAPSHASAQVGTPITNGVFQNQLDLGTSAVANVVQGGGKLSALDCVAILAGPRRFYALLSGDCVLPTAPETLIPVPEVPETTLPELEEISGLVTVTPEPSTLAMLFLPAGLVMVGLVRRRRGQSRV